MLQEAGATNLNITLDYATLENRELVEAIAGQFRDVGVNATLQGYELAVFNANWREDAQVGDTRFFSWGPIFDPYSVSQFVVHSKGTLSTFNDPESDRLIDQSSATLDLRQRDTILQQLDKHMSDNPWGVYVFTLAAVYGIDDKVPNFQPRPDDYIILSSGKA